MSTTRRDFEPRCVACGAAVQLREQVCPWCTTPYAASAEPKPPIEQTWDEDDDPSYGDLHIKAVRPDRAPRLCDVTTLADQGSRYVAHGVLTPNEVRRVHVEWARRYGRATLTELVARPDPPPGRIVQEAPWPLSTLFRALKGLFK